MKQLNPCSEKTTYSIICTYVTVSMDKYTVYILISYSWSISITRLVNPFHNHNNWLYLIQACSLPSLPNPTNKYHLFTNCSHFWVWLLVLVFSRVIEENIFVVSYLFKEFTNAIYAEITRLTVEYAWNAKFRKLWVECDSTLICLVFASFLLFLWDLQEHGINAYSCVNPWILKFLIFFVMLITA